jgi:hypothetical protein
MDRQSSARSSREGQINVQFRAPRELADAYREVVKREERTVAQALRLHMVLAVKHGETE